MPKVPKKPKMPKEIEFDYIKSNFFRVIRADGAFGGLAPNGAIHMGIYSERQPIPQKVVHAVQDGQLGPELLDKRQGRKAVIREMEVDVVLDIGQAIGLRQWLDDKIDQYKRHVGSLPTIPDMGSVKMNISDSDGEDKK